MKRIIKKGYFTIALGFQIIAAMANNPLATKLQVGMFKNSQTCIVLDNEVNFYNGPVREAVTRYWKVTGYEFIDQNEFEKRRKDPKYSFIVRMDGVFDKDPGGVSYSYICLLLGDASNNIAKMPEFCSVPLSYSGDLDADYEYVIPAVIKFMQIHVRNLENNRLPISLNGLRYYNRTGHDGKVLLFNKDKMAPDADSPEKIKAVCRYNVKLLLISEIQDEIASVPHNTLFHFHVGPPLEGGAGKCFEMLFDTDGNLYYYNSRKVTNDNTDGFNLNDFKNI